MGSKVRQSVLSYPLYCLSDAWLLSFVGSKPSYLLPVLDGNPDLSLLSSLVQQNWDGCPVWLSLACAAKSYPFLGLSPVQTQ